VPSKQQQIAVMDFRICNQRDAVTVIHGRVAACQKLATDQLQSPENELTILNRGEEKKPQIFQF